MNGRPDQTGSAYAKGARSERSQTGRRRIEVPAVVDNEAVRLREEMAQLKGSRIWRMGLLLQRCVAMLEVPRLLIGRHLGLTPLRGAEAVRADDRSATWRFQGEDPQIGLSWGGRGMLPPGHYELVLEINDASDDWAGEMKLYVDRGMGFAEGESIRLNFPHRGRCAVHLPMRFVAERLRLDPAERDGYLSLGGAHLRLMTRIEYYGRAVFRLMLAHQRAGLPLSRLLRSGWRTLRDGGARGVAAALRGRANAGSDYAAWIARHDTLTAERLSELRKSISTLPSRPQIAVLMPVYNTPEALLRAALGSVLGQVYEHWELCIADDCSTEPHVAAVLDEYERRDPRVRVVRRTQNGHISLASNSALELVRAEWVALLDHDDILRANALGEVALELARHPEAEIIYSDEDKISPGDQRFDPYFKPDFSRELFRSQNYLNHLTVHRAANIRAVGGWRAGFEGSQDYDLNLRICEKIGFRNIRHIPKILYHWRAVAGSTALDGGQKGYAYAAGFRALEDHVERLGLSATVEPVAGAPFYRLHYAVPEAEPLVSLIIPTRDRVDLLHCAISSIRDKTSYRNYEILVVDNGSSDPRTIDYMNDIASGEVARVLHFDRPFNFSSINNFAVSQSRGDIIGLINNDIEVISPNWLTEMVSWAIQPDIGCVGAKLYYSDDTIQHAGVVLGVGGVANHAFLRLHRSELGYFGRACVHGNWSAVTGACLLVRKEVYEAVRGLDEENLAVAFNDVDFCLKVGESGLRNVWTPFAELYHHESLSRGRDDAPEKRERFAREVNFMRDKWGDLLDADPYYSANFSKAIPGFTLLD